ncbi:MAG: Hsp20/alpha crystallin family protein [Desulfarculaceae bacterium]|jgi:HSP20 family protein
MAEIVRRDDTQAAAAEHTKTSPVFAPPVDIYETENELVLLADMPGVDKKDLTIRLEEDTLTLEGDVKPDSDPGLTPLMEEFTSGRYWRQFTLGQAIDRNKIEAKLKNGELRLVLPKAAAARPQKIEVKTA